MKLKASIRKDSSGRLTEVHVTKGKYSKRGIKLSYVYGEDGYIRDILFKGKKEQMPNFPQIIDLINESFIERISTVSRVTSITDSVEVDHAKIKGVALKDPSVAESIPISVENTAIAYDTPNDRFKVTPEQSDETKLKATTYPRVPSTLNQGTQTTTIGSAVALASSTPVLNSVLVQAKLDNTGNVKIGNSSAQPVKLKKGDVIVLVVDDVAKIYIDVTVDNEGVNWIAS